ncbi:MAG: hypothetical protein AABO58_21100 [Acidobacteriota bacterium]
MALAYHHSLRISSDLRRPAFLQNFLNLLVGPLWILNDLLPW